MYFFIKKSASGKTLQLLESFRNAQGSPRHRVVASLGDVTIDKSIQAEIAHEVENKLYGQCGLNLNISKGILYWVDRIVKQVDRQGKWKSYSTSNSSMPTSKNKNNIIKEEDVIDGVLIDQINHTHTTSVGPELLGLHAWHQLQFDTVLKDVGFNEVECKRAATSVISRLVCPSSENALLNYLESSSFPDIFGEEILRGSKHRFYNVSDKLLKNKKRIETLLREREQEYFNLKRTIILYDLTNSHFEGSCLKNSKAKRGKNKQKRNDCPQVVVGMIFDENGFELAHETFPGNFSDSKSLLLFIENMKTTMKKNKDLFDQKELVIVDAGIATKQNLKLLRKKGFTYLVNDSRRGRSKYADEFKKEDFEVIQGRDKKSAVEVRSIEESFFEEDEKNPKAPKKEVKEKLVLCRSNSRREKENAMLSQAETRFLEALNKLSKRIEEGRLKDQTKIQRAIGKILSRHPRVARFYSVTYKAEKKGELPSFKFLRNNETFQANEDLLGCYVLRSSQLELGQEELWKLYMTLTRAEDGFHALKSDLGLRPNYHQITSRVDGHIFITVLAYHLLQFILYTLTEDDDNRSWFTIKKILQTHCYTTIILPTKTGDIYRLRKVGTPEQCQLNIYEKFNINLKKLPQTKQIVKSGDFVVTHENDSHQ